MAQYFTLVLDAVTYPEGFPHRSRILYRPEPKELVIGYELPAQSVIPVERSYKYIQKRDAIDPFGRPVKEIQERYASVIAQVALRMLHHIFAVNVPDIVAAAAFGGFVQAKDKATGQPIRPYLISVSATREAFGELVLAELDPAGYRTILDRRTRTCRRLVRRIRPPGAGRERSCAGPPKSRAHDARPESSLR